ncbi:MAG TPA: YafY family protein [Thiobacillaceae bacterium]|nr:YafY family protein [Thiobacillaceae bacterium]HNU63830.1 YafY family protein [Thiobacillaceae bacterium]
MNQTERFYKIDQMLTDRGLVSFQDMLDVLEVSRATLRRDLEYMRTRLNAPIVYDRMAGGYQFDRGQPRVGGQYELPGLWFSSTEIHALLTMQHLLANLDPGGLLTPHVRPLMARLNALLGSADNPAEEIRRRVLVAGVGQREMQLAHFERVGSALLRRKRLLLVYHSKGKNERTEREVSPQRLVHYRENWYLDAWCHLRNALRNFAVDSIQHVETLEKAAREVSPRSVDAVLGPGYGIFTGKRVQWAELAFTPDRARWVATERWHPRQKGHFDRDGQYILEIPYADHRELIMDILKYGADVEVLGPDSLRRQVRAEHARAAARYRGRGG